MKDWYLRQTSRDRMIVLALAVLGVIGMFYAFIWYPIATGVDDNRTLITTKQETLQKMVEAKSKINALDGSGSIRTKDAGGKAPYTLIDELIRAGNLGKPDRVEPRGANGARVQFSSVEFDKLVLVLAELELYGLSVDTMNISRSPKASGMVSARFNVEKN